MKSIERLIKRIEKDYTEVANEFNELEKKQIMDRAYELAHYNEITDLICESVDVNDPPFSVGACKKALKHKGNLLKMVYNSWLNYNHPERYNFFAYEDLIDICDYAFNHC